METELLPTFVESPAYQTLGAQLKARANGLFNLTPRPSETKDPLAETGGADGSKKWGSSGHLSMDGGEDVSGAPTPREPNFDDVLAGGRAW
jgi:hypothetical protein